MKRRGTSKTIAGTSRERIENDPEPEIIRETYRGSDKLKDRVALITGGDFGIGRAVAVHFAREGADVAIIYLEEGEDAELTRNMVEDEGAESLILRGDIHNRKFCKFCVEDFINRIGNLNILVNNAGEQHVREGIQEINMDDVERTFRTNIISMFYLTQIACKQMQKGDSIINTESVVAYKERKYLIDYGATKGAIVAFTFPK